MNLVRPSMITNYIEIFTLFIVTYLIIMNDINIYELTNFKFRLHGNSLIDIYEFLKIPIYSRGFKSCKSPKSEINCNQYF